MTEQKDRRRHIFLEQQSKNEPYTYPRPVRGTGKFNLPSRHRSSHGQLLLQKLAIIQRELDQLRTTRQTLLIPQDFGFILELQSDPEFELALKSLDRQRDGIELLSVRYKGSVQHAIIFVPEGKINRLEELVIKYIEKDHARWGKPLNKTLVESISNIRRAVLDSFWTDEETLFPVENESIWWEIWLRTGSDRDQILEMFKTQALKNEIRTKDEILLFPDRTVLLAYCSREQMSKSVDLLDCIAELRRAKDQPSLYSQMDNIEQAEWIKDVLQRSSYPDKPVPAVCILDTGINRGHPLLQKSLDPISTLTYNDQWGTADHDGHGTEMAGLSLFGDLTQILSSRDPIKLEHELESVKILPPSNFHSNEPELYGAITNECISRAEVAKPHRDRVICMAITVPDYRDRGVPSSWSGEIDQLCAGIETHGKQLFLISAGNVQENEWRFYPEYNDVAQVQDPGQSWNAITVGGYTDLFRVTQSQYADWRVLARQGSLSPNSSTSITWKSQWPNKPDVVFEAGNAVVDPNDGAAIPIDELSLLTTNFKMTEKLLVTTWATSAATAQAARMAAILMSRYPHFWPETIRALIIHSAEWTKEMRTSSENNNTLLRRYGYGVPNLERACWSASNVLTLVSQDEINPFHKPRGSSTVKTKDMNLHELPWPREILQGLGEVFVELRVTLSYYVEPNPARRGWATRHRYRSLGLRFIQKKPEESLNDFRARASKNAQDEDESIPFPGDSEWFLGETLRNRGSIHSDIWEGPAVKLAERNYIAVFPVGGWWKERPHLNKWKQKVRYALIVTIRSPIIEQDIYTPVETIVKTKIDITI